MWYFVMRYWTLSIILMITLDKGNPEAHRFKLNGVVFTGFSILTILCIIFTCFIYFGIAKSFVMMTPGIMWLTEFIFLADALRRIVKVMK